MKLRGMADRKSTDDGRQLPTVSAPPPRERTIYAWAAQAQQRSGGYISPYQTPFHLAYSASYGVHPSQTHPTTFSAPYSVNAPQTLPLTYSASYSVDTPRTPTPTYSSNYRAIAPALPAQRVNSAYSVQYPNAPLTQPNEGIRPIYSSAYFSKNNRSARSNSSTLSSNRDISTSQSSLIVPQNAQISPSSLALFDDSSDNDDAAVSGGESDYLDLQSELAKFNDSFLNSEGTGTQIQGFGQQGGEKRRGGGRPRGSYRGPRKAAEPTGDIKIRLSQASQAFIEEKYDQAKILVFDVIRINAETHEAWALLAAVFRELGDVGRSLSALMYAAGLRPKDVQQWLNCARFALEETGDQRPNYLTSAKMCYSSAIRANPRQDYEGRIGKAAVLREMGNTGQAIAEYLRVLNSRPHDTEILRHLAEVYLDRDDPETARKLYQQSVEFYKTLDGDSSQIFDWSDVNIYIELFGCLGQYRDGIKELKSLSRWLLGRKLEVYWDFQEDDREWDAQNSRRIEVPQFNGNETDPSLYGDGLPLELRVKLGLYRLHLGHNDESLNHLLWLDPENLTQENRVLDYPDLFRTAADNLQDAGLFHEALKYYKSLQSLSDADASLHLQMGKCYVGANLNLEAEECFQMAVQVDESHIEARVQLTKLYEAINKPELAFMCVNEILNLRRTGFAKAKQREGTPDPREPGDTFMPPPSEKKYYYKPRRQHDVIERQRQEELKADHLKQQYAVMISEQNEMRDGQPGATAAWMSAAHDLVEDFRGFKKFYPWDKYVHFLGYSGKSRRKGATRLDTDIAAMAHRISDRLGAEIDGKSKVVVDIPENYRGISFPEWLDIFLEYALCLVKAGRPQESYEICEAAKDAVVFYHSREDMFLIYVCWCCCALLANDEESCVSTSRYFMREYQFTSDSYRMFAALTRMCQSPVSWYSSGPTQKYMLRQIKTMDYALVEKDSRAKTYIEKPAYSAQDDAGHLIINKEMDVALLMLYGHILYTGTSYSYALNYFFRAYALDPENDMIILSIGLGYVHWGLKRQSENRQFHIMQGLTFLFRYYNSRLTSSKIEERQEAHYNIARTYHTLGLTHLALPYYSKVLKEQKDREQIGREDLATDAAYNLQSLYTMAGNFEMAKIITDSWLVI